MNTILDTNKVAVAMSIYKSDKLEFIKQAISSISCQSYKNIHIFIEVDGKVNSDVESYLLNISAESHISINFNNSNKGLAFRLNQMIEKILKSKEYKYIARMDADDISMPERIKKQVDYFIKNPDVDIIGSDVIEIDEKSELIFHKRMGSSHEELLKNIIKKCPFNHPTVMFRIEVFSEAGLRYNCKLMNTQDYYLWVDAIKHNLVLANINEPLLKFRIDENFHSRRGLKKSINEFKSRIYAMKTLNMFSAKNITYSIALLTLRLSPEFVKNYAYKNLR